MRLPWARRAMSEKKIPLRMCMACRERKSKREMLRVVKSESGIHLDFSGKAEGRGAYLCNSEACLTKLLRYKLVNKTFSCNAGDEVYKAIEEEFRGRQN